MQALGAKILVVDDEPNVLLTLAEILRQDGYSVETAGNGVDALQALTAHAFDLVLTDLKMPHMDGLEILAAVQKHCPNAVTVMMTGYGSIDTAMQALQLGAYDYLLKPTDVTEFKAAVRRALERKRFSEIDSLYRFSRNITGSRNLSGIRKQLSLVAHDVLHIESVTVATLRGGHLDANCGAALSALLSNDGVRSSLSRGAVVIARDRARAKTAAAAGISASAVAYDSAAHNADSSTIDLTAIPAQGEIETEAAPGTAGVIRSIALVPGMVNDRLVCVICADNGKQPFEFHASAMRFLEGLANQTALALENLKLIEELQDNNQQLLTNNQRLRDLDAFKSQFLSIATHELRTPLSLIMGYNSMLAEQLEDRLGAEETEMLLHSVEACNRLVRMVNTMLDIRHIESGKMKMNIAPSDLRELVKTVAGAFEHEAEASDIRLHVQLPLHIAHVNMDPERIYQVLTNLVANALKFTRPGGDVTIAVQSRNNGRAIEVSVRDTGMGISAEQQSQLFREFSRLPQPEGAGRVQGTGLGLAIAQRITEAHGAKIEVSSQRGKGSTFRFLLSVDASGTRATAVCA